MKISHQKVHRDISYGPEPWQKLDIYLPEKTNTSAPVLVFFYGGRWTFGKKEQYAFVGKTFADAGYTVVLPDYAKYPEVRFPTFIEDAAKAVAWIHDHIHEYGGDGARLYVSGHSSGAHMGALISVNPSYLNNEGKPMAIIAAFAGLAGPYDFVPEAADLKDIFGPPDNYPNMQVPTFVNGKQPPMLLLHGADDEQVIQRNLNRLRAKIEATGGIVETRLYEEVDHIDIIGALSWVLKDKAPVKNDMLMFFDAHSPAR
ncbi:alpha/beta hydrolase [Microbulbifer bruguierae]|uniref:Alpha/beta hydrolase n=1 Tax=Microbulbifer bruguierae TaxID=3029061 RepID=A0ABY8ND83_9GAMM|nr:alpha/beta hydrolase [Microbulbifer bruguierae]WGL15393.1 alpha/beta hydrolase [Microbulbifer bruguierae]